MKSRTHMLSLRQENDDSFGSGVMAYIMVWCGIIICILSIMYFNKTLIGQAGSIGGSTRQEVEAGR